MTELHNPLFEEEKEFLERKKLEYERALRGDVEHLKDQSVMVGKVALVGAGLAGTIWLITKAFSGKSKKSKRRPKVDEAYYRDGFDDREEFDDYDGFDDQDGFDDDDDDDDDQYFTSGDSKRYRSKVYHPGARDSAAVFMAHAGEVDDLGFGASAPVPEGSHFAAPADTTDTTPHGSASAYTALEEEDPFRDLPYDDSRRLPAAHSFDESFDEGYDQEDNQQQPSLVGSALKSFLQSDTGKVIVAQVAAVALAVVTKKINEFFPAAKNPDLATSPGFAPAETGISPVASSVSLSSPDASINPQPV